MRPYTSPFKRMNLEPLQLLVVDNDDVDREKIGRLLIRAGLNAHITEASSAREAIEIGGRQWYDCIFLDYHLGDAIGLDVFTALNHAPMEQPCPPVIMITGQGDESLAVSLLKAGVRDYIPKERLTSDLLYSVLLDSLHRFELEHKIQEQQERLEHLSLYDSLTNIPNRTLFFDRLEHEIHLALRMSMSFAVLLLDLDLFKEVNDTLGHEAGDTVLQTCAQRVQEILRDSDTVARLGGDEFAVLLSGTNSVEGAMIVAEKILTQIRTPIPIGDAQTSISASIGIALFPQHGNDSRQLIAHADMAMYRAKEIHCGYEVYGNCIEPRQRSILLASRLRTAIEEKELFVEFQPVVHLDTREVVAVEALVRWSSPEHGLISPSEFIPVAERSAIIKPLTYAVLDMALTQLAHWRTQGIGLQMSVNLSARLINDPELAQRVQDSLTSRHLPPDCLTLELTETAIMEHVERARDVVSSLRALGIHISIDDFGAGFTSFKYLRELDISEIKIDQIFNLETGFEARDQAIIRSMIMLARGLNVKVVAEGIENPKRYQQLQDLGCALGQGYAIGRPMSAERFIEWMKAWQAASTL